MDRNTSRLLLVLFKRYYRGASMKPCRRVPLWCSFCNIGVKGHLWKMSKIAIYFYIMDIFLENSLLLQLKNAGIMQCYVFDQIISFLFEKICASKLKKKIQKLQMELNHRKTQQMKIFSGKCHKNLTRNNGVYEV